MNSSFNAKKLLIIGSRGFIGRHFCRFFPHASQLNRGQLDLTDPHFESQEEYHYALIAAGMGNPRLCAQHPEQSYACNVEGTLKLGKELLKRGIIPIFLSSDYVFNDALEIAPLNAYGKQKKELEEEAAGMNALVVRLSKVYGLDRGDGTLFDEMAQRLINNQKLKVAFDQVFSPICIHDVVNGVMTLLQNQVRGLVTLCGPNFASRLEMAELLCEKLNCRKSLIQKISIDDLNDGIKRPKRLTLQGHFPTLSWQEGIDKMVENYV